MMRKSARESSSVTRNVVIDIEDLYSKVFDVEKSLPELRLKLLKWYDKNRRILPWRGDAPPYKTSEGRSLTVQAANTTSKLRVSPYATWVSEVMLQQTRVETVIDYYTRWMKLFPTIADLAKADPAAVNAAWAGLGYYSRARNLQKGAKYIIASYDGEMPSSVDELCRIPGIGDYTAGAIASIAFNQPQAVVDGNVIRVYSRLARVAMDAKNKALHRASWKFGARLIDLDRPGDFNQSLMELGATICTPKKPSCSKCPVRELCAAHLKDPFTVTEYPLKVKRKAIPEEIYDVAIVTKTTSEGKEYLTLKRPERGLLAGQYEFPSVIVNSTYEKPRSSNLKRKRESAEGQGSIDTLINRLGICKSCILSRAERRSLGVFTHVFSHKKYVCHVESIALQKEHFDCDTCETIEAKWQTEEQLRNNGQTKLLRKSLELLSRPSKSKQEKQGPKGQTLLSSHFKNLS